MPAGALFGALVVLILLSGFFSGSETGLMTLNRYRLRHLARHGHRGARLAQALLRRPDRLIGLILLGNNFVNILASSVATVLALRLLGEAGIAVAAGLLTLVILILAEVAPKTLAALHPERVAFPAAYVYTPLLRLLYPLVWLVNTLANGVLRLLGVDPAAASAEGMSREELRTVLHEAASMFPGARGRMLLGILDLERVTVEDIMIPRTEIVGLDLEDTETPLAERLRAIPYTRIPLYRGSIDEVTGILHVRDAMRLLLDGGEITPEALAALARPPLFIPEHTPLNRQLLQFQGTRERVGLVVDEYGEILGLVSMEDLLEEIVGEFTTDPLGSIPEAHPQEDGSWVVEGGASVRELNRGLGLHLPTDGPKTLNGLVLEHLEQIPEPGTSILIAGYPVEILQTQDNMVKTARIYPRRRRRE